MCMLVSKRKQALTIYQQHTWTSQALSSTGSSPFEPIHAFLVKVLYDHPYFTNGKTEAQRGEVIIGLQNLMFVAFDRIRGYLEFPIIFYDYRRGKCRNLVSVILKQFFLNFFVWKRQRLACVIVHMLTGYHVSRLHLTNSIFEDTTVPIRPYSAWATTSGCTCREASKGHSCPLRHPPMRAMSVLRLDKVRLRFSQGCNSEAIPSHFSFLSLLLCHLRVLHISTWLRFRFS